MKNLREMKVDELKDIARGYTITGAWKMTKDKLIESILANAKMNGQANLYFDGQNADPEPEETKIPEDYEATIIDGTLVAVSRTEDITETAEDEEPEVKEAETKEVKRPSLKINEIAFNGKTQSLRDWAEELKMPWPTLYDRINRNGWTIEEALTIPLGSRRKKKA